MLEMHWIKEEYPKLEDQKRKRRKKWGKKSVKNGKEKKGGSIHKHTEPTERV